MLLTTFEIILLTHFISDWWMQPAKWATGKKKSFNPLLYHSIQYSAVFIPVFWLLKINLMWTLLLFATHFLIDDYKFVTWFNERVRGSKDNPPWVLVVYDQILHVLVLAVVVAFS